MSTASLSTKRTVRAWPLAITDEGAAPFSAGRSLHAHIKHASPRQVSALRIRSQPRALTPLSSVSKTSALREPSWGNVFAMPFFVLERDRLPRDASCAKNKNAEKGKKSCGPNRLKAFAPHGPPRAGGRPASHVGPLGMAGASGKHPRRRGARPRRGQATGGVLILAAGGWGRCSPPQAGSPSTLLTEHNSCSFLWKRSIIITASLAAGARRHTSAEAAGVGREQGLDGTSGPSAPAVELPVGRPALRAREGHGRPRRKNVFCR
jgi:hypothetical protein